MTRRTLDQLKALTKKNLISIRRGWLGTFFELFIPIFFVYFYGRLKEGLPSEIYPE